MSHNEVGTNTSSSYFIIARLLLFAMDLGIIAFFVDAIIAHSAIASTTVS